MTGDELARVLSRLEANWPDKLNDDALEMWQDELGNLEFSPAYAAARQLTLEAKYFPRLSEFLESYGRQRARQMPYEERHACRRCDGSGWMVTDAERNEVIPCSTCRTVQFEYWSRGEVPPTPHPRTLGLFAPRTEYDRPDATPETVARLKALRDGLAAIRGVS